jgi:transposase
MSRKSIPVVLSGAEIIRLEQWIRAGSTPQQVVLRARMILAAARGSQDKQIATQLKVHRFTVALWRRRVREQGIGCVWEIAPGRGRKACYGTEVATRIVEATLQSKPKGSTHWSTRTLADAQGVSKNTIHRLWQEHQLKPHLTKSFKLSRDPKFLEKLTDVVGVYLTPRQTRWCFVLMRRAKFKHWIARNRACHSNRAAAARSLTTTNETAPPPCLPRCRWSKDVSSVNAIRVTATRNF